MALQRREVLILAAVGAAAAGAGILVGPLWLQTESGAARLLSAQFSDLEGRPRSLDDWKGKLLVCNFWASWCQPCIEEIPLLNRVRDRFAAKGVEVVGIALDSVANLAQFMKTTPIHYPVLVADGSGIEILRRLGNSAGGLPYTVILDRSGALTHRKLGAYRSESELEAALKG